MFFYPVRALLPLLLILIYFSINSADETGQISPASPLIQDYKLFDVNNIRTWSTNYGSFFRNPVTSNSGFEWPKDSGSFAIYAAGLWLGAKVNEETRVAIAEYASEFGPGNINPLTHLAEDSSDSLFKVYKIGEGGNYADYQNWPGQLGAPVDSIGNPLLIGDQTLWTVYNDADTSVHINMGSLPLGIEVQQTVFGWKREFHYLNDVVFIKWLIINRGFNSLDSLFISFWCDAELGNSPDDLTGCDTTLALGFCYNGSDNDYEYGQHPPAVGFQVLQGPIASSLGSTAIYQGRKIKDFRNEPMSSFVGYIHNNTINGNPHGPIEFYRYMKGQWRDGSPITYGGMGIDPGNPHTLYMFTGDPESGNGWLQSRESDVRLLENFGPFHFMQGDSQEIVIAAFIGRGTSNLNSVTVLRNIAGDLKSLYEEYLYKEGRSYHPEPPEPPIPKELGLFQNYPNPFNSSTTIKYQLPIPRTVRLEIFNAAGQRVATLVNEPQEPDEYEVVWDAGGLASGIYFARLRVAQYVFTKKLLLLK